MGTAHDRDLIHIEWIRLGGRRLLEDSIGWQVLVWSVQ